jgi:uncharacterized membrane protein YbaN (DUF454 family)
MKNVLFVAIGIIALSVGVIGIFLPVLPTTPFILVSAGCFMKSSRRLYRWLTGHKILGPYIDNWCKYRAITKQSKIVSIAVLWCVMISTVAFGVQSVWMRIGLVVIAAAVTVHLALLRTLTPEMMDNQIPAEVTQEQETDL